MTKFAWGVAALMAASATSARADAPGDAWAAARAVLPAAPDVVVGMNLAAIRGSLLFQRLYPKLLEQAGEARQGLDELKATCGIDVQSALQGAVVFVDGQNRGAVFLSAKGVDKARVSDCLVKMSAKSKKQVAVNGPDEKGIVEYSDGTAQKLYVAYLPKGVIVIATDPNDRALLRAALSGGGIGAGNDVGRALAATNTGATVWAIVHKPQQLDETTSMKVGYGSADLQGGNVAGELRLVLGSDKEAADAVTKANTGLAEAKKNGEVPPQLQSVVKTLKIACATPKGAGCGSPELLAKAQISEREAVEMIEKLIAGEAPPR
jgi:hypothetical protein